MISGQSPPHTLLTIHSGFSLQDTPLKIEAYYQAEGELLSFSREQASRFAKAEAGDFNPIHDVEARRFCVPGDLLFSVVLHRIGLYQSMAFEFLQLVTDAHQLRISQNANTFELQDNNDRTCLRIDVSGDRNDDAELARELSRAYIEFSGVTFPYLLVDLMRDNNVMINPSRPLVMYKSMSFSLDRFDSGDMTLDYAGGSVTADGKKAEVILPFAINSGEKTLGRGSKEMLLGGLRAFDDKTMESLVDDYNAIKNRYGQ